MLPVAVGSIMSDVLLSPVLSRNIKLSLLDPAVCSTVVTSPTYSAITVCFLMSSKATVVNPTLGSWMI